MSAEWWCWLVTILVLFCTAIILTAVQSRGFWCLHLSQGNYSSGKLGTVRDFDSVKKCQEIDQKLDKCHWENCLLHTLCLALCHCLLASCVHVSYTVNFAVGIHNVGRRAAKSWGKMSGNLIMARDWSVCGMPLVWGTSRLFTYLLWSCLGTFCFFFAVLQLWIMFRYCVAFGHVDLRGCSSDYIGWTWSDPVCRHWWRSFQRDELCRLSEDLSRRPTDRRYRRLLQKMDTQI